jgi:hypothetical protein
VVVLVGDEAEEADRHHASCFRESSQRLDDLVGGQVEVRCDDEPVAAEVVTWVGEVDRDVGGEERPVPVEDELLQIERLRWMVGPVERPPETLGRRIDVGFRRYC